MKRSRRGILILLLAASAAAEQPFDWRLSPGFPRPPIPADDPMSAARVELGRRLFYDTRLSVNGRQSCVSCHRQELAFTDGLARAKGTTGEVHPRSSMSLVNVAYAPALTWADPKLDSLERQALIPLLGTEPVELGLRGQEPRVLRDLRTVPEYRDLFPTAFPVAGIPYRLENVAKALAAFQRTIVSTRSPPSLSDRPQSLVSCCPTRMPGTSPAWLSATRFRPVSFSLEAV